MFSFLPAHFMSSAYTDKNNPFHGLQVRIPSLELFSQPCSNRSIPKLELFPNRAPIECSRIAVPTTVLPEDDRADSAQVERLDLPYWTKILAICAVVDVSKCLDIPILEFSIISEHLRFLTWV